MFSVNNDLSPNNIRLNMVFFLEINKNKQRRRNMVFKMNK